MADVKIAGGHVTIARSSNDIVAQNLSASMEELQLVSQRQPHLKPWVRMSALEPT